MSESEPEIREDADSDLESGEPSPEEATPPISDEDQENGQTEHPAPSDDVGA